MNFLKSKMLLALCLIFALGGCQTYTLVKAERVSVGDRLSLEPDIQWNKRTVGRTEVWTVDGEALQALHLYKGLANGEVLFPKLHGEIEEEQPQYEPGMSLLEIREFIEASIVQTGFPTVKTVGIKPEKVAGHDGFRMEFTYTSKTGLNNSGIAVGAIVDTKLYMMLYRGAKLHYYGKYLQNVETLIRSMQVAWSDTLL